MSPTSTHLCKPDRRNQRRQASDATQPTLPAIPAHRTDLIIRRQEYRGQTAYFVKDPLTLRYFRFAPAEYRLFQQLDGKQTSSNLVEAVSREFGVQQVADAEILRLVARWQQAGLLSESGTMATARILATQQNANGSNPLKPISDVLYIKVRAIDPDALLNQLYPWVRWLFQPPGILLAVCSMCAAALLVAGRFEQFTSRPELQDLQAFFNLQNIFWLWLSVGVVKVLHEFGHGLTCKHFGGECHAMGLLLMCFTPCMYCDVSDAWMMPNKWHRIAIAAAGIYVELLIASLATFVWWTTNPGVLHSIAFSAMLYASVQTILINANPLMRFDGYYAMSDFLEVPNLRQRSMAFTRYYLKKWFWGSHSAPPGAGGLPFMAYAVAASLYRIVFTVSMLWIFVRILKPYKLAAVGWVLAGMMVVTLLMPLARGIVTAIRHPSGLRPESWWRPCVATVLMAVLAGAFFYAPIPRRAYAVLTVEPARSSLVSAATRGRIVKQYVAAGAHVRQGDPLLELDNRELRNRTAQTEKQRDLLQVKARVATALLDPAGARQSQVALKETESQLSVLHQRVDELLLRAPCDGWVIPEPERPTTSPISSNNSLPLGHWKRSIFHPENIGATVESGTSICQIAQSQESAAVAVLPQRDIETVRIGQAAAVKLDAYPEATFLGTVQEISVQEVERAPLQLLNVNGSELPAISFGSDAGHLATAHYQVRIVFTGLSHGELTDWQSALKPGLRGRTWVRIGSQTMAAATWRRICQAFDWRLD